MNSTLLLETAMSPHVNAVAAWAGALLGVVSGIASGLAFHREDWLGGYTSWPRRLLRLGHLSFFGVAALNLAYALTWSVLAWPPPPAICSIALAISNFLMPLVCILAAWDVRLRHLFALPVSCIAAGVGGMLWMGLGMGG